MMLNCWLDEGEVAEFEQLSLEDPELEMITFGEDVVAIKGWICCEF